MPRQCSAPYVVAVVVGSFLACAGIGVAAAIHLFDRITGSNQP